MPPSTLVHIFLYKFSVLRKVPAQFIHFVLFLLALFILLAHYPLAPMPLFYIYEFLSSRISFNNSSSMNSLLCLMVLNPCCFIYQLFNYLLSISSEVHNLNGTQVSITLFLSCKHPIRNRSSPIYCCFVFSPLILS